jgi:hypothetical protein
MTNFKYVVYYNSTYENTIGTPDAHFNCEQDAEEYVERQNPTLQHRYTIVKADK